MNQPIINQDISPPWGSCENRSVIDSIVSGKDIKELVAKPQSGGNLWKAVDVRSCCFRGLYYIYYIQGVPGPPYQKKNWRRFIIFRKKKNSLVVRRELFGAGICKIYGQIPPKESYNRSYPQVSKHIFGVPTSMTFAFSSLILQKIKERKWWSHLVTREIKAWKLVIQPLSSSG